jgi:hypothetical protein
VLLSTMRILLLNQEPVHRQATRRSMTKAIPEGFHSVTPMFMFKDARKAIEF